jgi:hypothetical protein
MLTLLPKRCPKEIMKIFLIEDFFHLPPVSTTSVVPWSSEYLHEFLKKFEMALMIHIIRGLGKLIHVENLK